MIVSAKHTSLLFSSAIFFMYSLTHCWIQTLDLMNNSRVFYHSATAAGQQTSLQSCNVNSTAKTVIMVWRVVTGKHTSLPCWSNNYFLYPVTASIQTLDLMINSQMLYCCATAADQHSNLQSWTVNKHCKKCHGGLNTLAYFVEATITSCIQ